MPRGTPVHAPDLMLMGAIGAGDRDALETLYARHAGGVMALALRVLRDRAAAEDTVIDVFVELWERPGRFDPARGSPAAYLFTLARSRAIDRLRSSRSRRHGIALVVGDSEDAEREAAATPDAATPLDDALSSERRERLGSALAQLPPEQRRAIELAFLEGLTHGEIAERLGVPLGTVKTRIRRGLLRVRRVLEEGERR